MASGPERPRGAVEDGRPQMQALSTTVKGAADMLGIGRTTVYSLINEKKLQTIKIGRRTLVKTESIRALVDQAA
jgi:excisionase family DNA binding protein